jgi:hypothetical protein
MRDAVVFKHQIDSSLLKFDSYNTEKGIKWVIKLLREISHKNPSIEYTKKAIIYLQNGASEKLALELIRLLSDSIGIE